MVFQLQDSNKTFSGKDWDRDANKGFFQNIKDKIFIAPDDKQIALVDKYTQAVANGDDALSQFLSTLDDKDPLKTYFTTLDGGIATQDGMTGALNKTTLASKAATLGMKALNVAMNMALTMGAMWIVFEGIPKLIDAMTVTVEEHREALDELKTAYSSTNKELTSINSELETTGKRISELQDKLSLTFVEQEELSKLQGVTSELERQKGILEAQQKIEQAGVNKAFVDTMDASQNGTSTHKYYSYEDSNNDGKQSVWEGINSGTVTYTDKQGYTDHQFKELETLNQQLIQAEEDYQAALENGNEKQQKTLSNRNSNYRNQIQKIKEELNKELKTLQSDSNGISYIENPTNADEESVNKWLDFIADFEDKIAIAVNGEGAKTVAFDRIINKEEFAEAKKELEELAASGNLTAEKLNDSKYEGLAKELDDVSISAEDASAQLNEMYASQDGHKSPDLSIPTLEDANKQLDDLQSKYQTLSSVIDDYNTKGFMTIDNLQSFLSLGNEYMQYLSIENGQLVMNKDALTQLALARIDEAEAAYLETATNLIGTFTEESAAAAYLKSDTDDLANSKLVLADANWNVASSAAAAKAAETGDDTAVKAVETLKKTVANARVVFDVARSSVGKYSSAISEAGSASQNASKQISDAQKNINNLLSMTIQMLRKEYELQKEVLQDKKKALEFELKGLQKKIDLQLELLQKKKEEHDYERDLKGKQKDVSDIQNEIFKLQNDDSAEARKRRLELEAELADKLDALNEFLFDNEIKLQEDALNKEKDRVDEEYQNKQSCLDQEIEAIEKYVSMEVNLRLEAMALIEGRSQEFYNRLQLWNYQYGDGIRATIDLAWQSCYASMDIYNQGQYNVSATLELLARKMADFENATKNATVAANNLNDALAQQQTEGREQLQNKIQEALGARRAYRPGDSEYKQYTDVINDYKKQLENLPKHHTGGVVSGVQSNSLSPLAGVTGGEVLIKALKGELVVTQQQQANLIKSLSGSNILPNMLKPEYSISTGNIVLNGGFDKKAIEMVKKSQQNQLDDLITQLKTHDSKGGVK